jgi:type IV pilus assembly protein PilA
LAIAFALCGSLVAVAAPAFVREVHASRLVEPVEGLKRLGGSAVAYAQEHAPAQGAGGSAGTQASSVFPPSAPLTPSSPPRGHCEVDPPDAWDHPTWIALGFRAVAPGTPHCFAFAFDSVLTPSKSTFRARAHGDLDGDGIFSTFEVTGRLVDGDAQQVVIDPGMFVDSEME